MTEIRFPKSPAQTYREATAHVAAFNTGVALRVVWEVTKQITKWAAVISLAIAVGGIYFILRLLFGTMNR